MYTKNTILEVLLSILLPLIELTNADTCKKENYLQELITMYIPILSGGNYDTICYEHSNMLCFSPSHNQHSTFTSTVRKRGWLRFIYILYCFWDFFQSSLSAGGANPRACVNSKVYGVSTNHVQNYCQQKQSCTRRHYWTTPHPKPLNTTPTQTSKLIHLIGHDEVLVRLRVVNNRPGGNSYVVDHDVPAVAGEAVHADQPARHQHLP